MAFCGLDFGTSNSTLGTAQGASVALVPLEGQATTLPSAIFFDFTTGASLIGREAIGAYVGGAEGRLMRSVKSILGTSLIDEETRLLNSRIGFRAVIGRLLAEIKRRAETATGIPLDAVVHGRPVHFVDGDDAADRAAQQALEEIAHGIGFRHVSFEYEPIAAALDYEQQVTAEEIALIADIGGGTSDFSIVRLGPHRREQADRSTDILANDGVRIGGTDFDRLLSLAAVMPHLGYQSPMLRPGLLAPNGYYVDLATWSRINFLYAPKVLAELRQVRHEARRPALFDRLIQVIAERRGHTLAIDVEAAKIGLSEAAETALSLDWVEPGLAVTITRTAFERATGTLASGIAARIALCLAQAGLTADRISTVFLTGGSTLLPHVRAGILAAVPAARVVEGDKFGSVGLGLTLRARRLYR
ncbi:MAG TPA: Hsp70 family protein [Stellaceae bacterium]|nr:Hsp70 family protein [Stellaceae bacterium]